MINYDAQVNATGTMRLDAVPLQAAAAMAQPAPDISPVITQLPNPGPQQPAVKEDPSVSKTIGQISNINLPRGWADLFTEPYKGIGFRSYSEVRLSGDKDVAISFFFRGFPLQDEQQARAFHNIITGSPHTLIPSELKSIREVLQDKAGPDAFAMLSARTQKLNGKAVLIVEGRYKNLQQDAYHIYVDTDGAGSYVQEIFYQAPHDRYLAYLKEAKDSFNSIQWFDF